MSAWAAGTGLGPLDIQNSLAPATDKGLHIALDDLQPDKAFVI
jgi:hypothetical protein